MRHATLLAVTSGARLLGGKQNIGGLAAMLSFVAGETGNFEVFAMIEARADQPPVWDDWFGHMRDFLP